MMSISQGNFFLNYLIIIFSCLQATRNRAPSVAWWARRGFEGVYLAGGRPTRGRRAWARDGGGGGSEWLVSYCKHVLNIKGQGWIFGCLPCMFPNMRVQKIWQNRFFVMHTCIQLNLVPWISEDSQEYYPWLEILFIENS